MNIHQNTNVLIVAYTNDVINSRNQSELAVISSLHMESALQILNATQAFFLLVSKFCFCVFFFFPFITYFSNLQLTFLTDFSEAK